MAGNVWEWCEDYFSPAYHRVTSAENPLQARAGRQPLAARRIVSLSRILLQPLPRRGAQLEYAGQFGQQYRISRRSGLQIHVDADEIAAIGDFAEIDHGSVGGREHPPNLGHRRIQGNLQQLRHFEVGGADRQRLPRVRDRRDRACPSGSESPFPCESALDICGIPFRRDRSRSRNRAACCANARGA